MGVLHGSVLDPLSVSLYINDLLQLYHDVNQQMYADDAVVNKHAKTAELAVAKLTIVLEWFTHCHCFK